VSSGRRASTDRFDDTIRARMVSTYRDTSSVAAVCERFGVSDGYARSVLRAAGLSSAELARLAGLKGPSHIGMIERGERSEISGSTAVEIARVLGTTAEYLIAGRGAPPSEEEVRAAVDAARRGAARAEGPVVVRDPEFDQRSSVVG